MNAAQALLSHAIDYAGMFPPAGVDLETAVRSYEAYRAGEDAWALARLIFPMSAIAEFADRWPSRVREWPISLLLSESFADEVQTALGLGFAVDVVECRPARLEQIAEMRRLLRTSMLFIEMPARSDLESWLRAIAAHHAYAKIRTGGVTASSIPATASVADFLVACARCDVRFKATAGLHRAVRGDYALTYAENAPRARMHGFVNFFVAAVLAMRGEDERRVEACLADGSPNAFTANEDLIAWREHRFETDEIERMRRAFAISFGSCSFEEPLAEMRAMGWMA